MSTREELYCPECDEVVTKEYDRRDFIRVLGGTAALAAATTLPAAAQAPARPATRASKPAESLIQELYNSMTAEQRRSPVVRPWNNPARTAINPNRATDGQTIGQHYTAAQKELIERIVRAVSNGDEGYRLISRGGTWDASQTFENCGSHIFGEPGSGQPYAWVFTGHHLTIRCDGNSAPDTAFGGPIYYGHSPDGHSRRNLFYFQTQAVNSVFDALTEAQRQNAVILLSRETNPGEGQQSVQFRQQHPGLRASEMTADQRRLVETVMREALTPYRREDTDEVMELIRRNGGLDRLHLAFYREPAADNGRWTFWRIEGPGFVWNYRVLPHVHTYVNIAAART